MSDEEADEDFINGGRNVRGGGGPRQQGGGNRSRQDESDDEDRHYVYDKVPTINARKYRLSRSDRYNNQCYLCMHQLFWTENNVTFRYKPINPKTLERMDTTARKCILDGTFRGNGSIKIALDFNESCVKAANNLLSTGIRPYNEITAQQVENHYLNCIETPENAVLRSLYYTGDAIESLFKEEGMWVTHTSKMTRSGEPQSRLSTKGMKDFLSLSKNQREDIRLLKELRTVHK